MRTLRLVGLSHDGAGLVVECDGEHFLLPLDAAVRTAVTSKAPTPALPFDVVPAAREIQRRIRHGETVEAIAADAQVPVERIARYEGPPMADRAHQADLAQGADSDGRPLGERVRKALTDHGIELRGVRWDSRVTDEAAGKWLVTCEWPGGSASWEWSPLNRKARAADALARELTDTREQIDDLTAVLRPLHTSRSDVRPDSRPRPTVVPLPVPGSVVEYADDPAGAAPGLTEAPTEPVPIPAIDAPADEDDSPDAPAAEAPAPEAPRGNSRKPRPAVPAWETILGTLPPRE